MAEGRRANGQCIIMLMVKVDEHTETGQMYVTPRNRETDNYNEGSYG